MIPRLTSVTEPPSAYEEFAVQLRLRGFEGQIEGSYAHRTTLATDNSIYQVLPSLTVFPRSIEDVTRIVKLLGNSEFRGIKVFPRGGGTGTNGQSLGDGVVVDISRHMNRILEINVEERWARVQAGVVKDQLDAAVKEYGLFFAPELSTSNRATVGGMVSTDASGQGSCRYGKTRDHVLELRTVFLDGTIWDSHPLDEAALVDVRSRDDMVGEIHRTVDSIARSNAQLIKDIFPPLNRCLTGYDLAHVRDAHDRFDLNSILCGSEGTLGFVVEAKVNLVPIPLHTALVVVSYRTFDAALRDAPRLLKLDAASIEAIDPTVIGLARQDITWPSISHFFPNEVEEFGGVNVVEFAGEDLEILERTVVIALEKFATSAQEGAGVAGYHVVRDESEINSIWMMRKRAVGLLGRLSGPNRPIPFVEDTAVPPENLADYIGEFRDLLDSNGLKYGMFGHADAGVLHVRPAIDMKDVKQEALIRLITDKVVALTRKYKGVLWGEHGKGVRAEYAPQFFGPLYPALQKVKLAVDPHYQLNPGKIVAPEGQELLRVDGVPTRGQFDRIIPIAVREEYGGALHCNGNGACFNYDQDDAMCPSWKATRDRRFSPKGRASLLREWLRMITVAGYAYMLEGRKRPTLYRKIVDFPQRWRNSHSLAKNEYDFSQEVKEAMDTCLACKSCAGQCPIKVDVPSLRSKFLALYHTRYLRPAKDWMLALLEPCLPWIAKAPKLANRVLSSRLAKAILERFNLVALPTLSTVKLGRQLEAEGFGVATPDAVKELRARGAKPVIFVQDAFTSYFESELVLAAFRLVGKLGFVPLLAPYRPNGKPLHVHGFLEEFERTASKNMELLRSLAGLADLVGVDPAMTLVYRSEYRDVASPEEIPPVLLFQEWLLRMIEDGQVSPGSVVLSSQESAFFLLPHCTERTNAAPSIEAWRRVFSFLGAELEILPSGCCGMSGTFGHEAKNRAMSESIYRLSWGGLVNRYKSRGYLMASGFSCRSQTKIMEGNKLRHPIQVLNELMLQG